MCEYLEPGTQMRLRSHFDWHAGGVQGKVARGERAKQATPGSDYKRIRIPGKCEASAIPAGLFLIQVFSNGPACAAAYPASAAGRHGPR